MSREAALTAGCIVLALASVGGALRCLADRLLASAAIYTVLALALVGGAAKAAIAAL